MLLLGLKITRVVEPSSIKNMIRPLHNLPNNVRPLLGAAPAARSGPSTLSDQHAAIRIVDAPLGRSGGRQGLVVLGPGQFSNQDRVQPGLVFRQFLLQPVVNQKMPVEPRVGLELIFNEFLLRGGPAVLFVFPVPPLEPQPPRNGEDLPVVDSRTHNFCS